MDSTSLVFAIIQTFGALSGPENWSQTVVYGAVVIGVVGLVVEVATLGATLPGLLGAISLLIGVLGLFVLEADPVAVSGVFLSLVAVGFGATRRTYGVVPLLGSALVGWSSWALFPERPLPAAVVVLGTLALCIPTYVFVAMWSKSRKVGNRVVGDTFLDTEAEVARVEGQQVWVRIRGELWKAIGSGCFQVGQRVVVTAREGLVLHIEGGSESDGSATPYPPYR